MSRNRQKLVSAYQQSMEMEFNYSFERIKSENRAQKASGRPEKPFAECLPNSKRNKVSNDSRSADDHVKLGLLSAKLSAKRQGDKVTSEILNEVLKNQQLSSFKFRGISGGLVIKYFISQQILIRISLYVLFYVNKSLLQLVPQK